MSVVTLQKRNELLSPYIKMGRPRSRELQKFARDKWVRRKMIPCQTRFADTKLMLRYSPQSPPVIQHL